VPGCSGGSRAFVQQPLVALGVVGALGRLSSGCAGTDIPFPSGPWTGSQCRIGTLFQETVLLHA
jgi:hypothetical protein